MDFFKEFATDTAAEETGRPLAIGDAVFQVARAGNRAYNRQLQAEWKAHEHLLQRANAADATEHEKAEAEVLSFKLIGRVMARTVLLSWSGKVDYKRTELPYSIDNAELLLSHKDFRERINEFSASMRNYLVAEEAANAKNSETTSGGTSNGGPA